MKIPVHNFKSLLRQTSILWIPDQIKSTNANTGHSVWMSALKQSQHLAAYADKTNPSPFVKLDRHHVIDLPAERFLYAAPGEAPCWYYVFTVSSLNCFLARERPDCIELIPQVFTVICETPIQGHLVDIDIRLGRITASCRSPKWTSHEILALDASPHELPDEYQITDQELLPYVNTIRPRVPIRPSDSRMLSNLMKSPLNRRIAEIARAMLIRDVVTTFERYSSMPSLTDDPDEAITQTNRAFIVTRFSQPDHSEGKPERTAFLQDLCAAVLCKVEADGGTIPEADEYIIKGGRIEGDGTVRPLHMVKKQGANGDYSLINQCLADVSERMLSSGYAAYVIPPMNNDTQGVARLKASDYLKLSTHGKIDLYRRFMSFFLPCETVKAA